MLVRELKEKALQFEQATAALHESEERYRKLFEANPHPMWVYDLDTLRFLAVNDAAVAHYGYSQAEFLQMTIADIRPAEELPRLIDNLRSATAGLDQSGVWRHRRKDGGTIEVEVASHTLEFGGRQAKLVLAHDITERGRLEQQVRQSQKMEAIGQLAGGIAHDFNNLLGTIIGNAELARLDLSHGHAALASIQEILRAGQRAKELVQRLLSFGRPHEPEREAIALQPILEEAVRLLRSTLPAGVELVVRAAPGAPAVQADASQIHQIMLNLATNAWHAMESCGGRIEIRLEECRVDSRLSQANPDLRPGPHVRLSVSDTGKGIDPAILGRIFEPFFTTKPAGQGTGLGLSVVHGIMRSHGGAVVVESEPGRGSTFHLYFPASTEPAAATVAAPPAADIHGHGEHILYLDDEEPLVYLAVRFLERLGYRVTGYTRASEALDAFRADAQSFDLIITDFNMPGMSGMDVAQQLISIRPDAPVVLSSGYLRPAEIEKARSLGVREVILKPNTVEELGPLVQRLLSARD